MTLQSDVKTVLTANTALMAILTGGVHIDVEEINTTNTPTAFDSNDEIKPCALIKLGTEIPTGPFVRGVQTPIIIYFYQRQGFASIDPALVKAFDLLNETQTGDGVWNLQYSNTVFNQRDTALDCALSTLRFIAVRLR